MFTVLLIRCLQVNAYTIVTTLQANAYSNHIVEISVRLIFV